MGGSRYIRTYWIAVILLMLLAPDAVHAHKPLQTSAPATRSHPIVVSDHQVSRAAYTQLTRPREVDYYRFTARTGEEIFSSMLIPRLKRLHGFSPTFALIGPGLPNKTAGIPVEDFLDIKDDEGINVALYEGEKPKVFFEPFTQTRYWRKQELRAVAPSSGEYYFAVFDHTGNSGKYVFCIGEKEHWKIRDIVAMPRIWWQTRMFAEEKISTYFIVGGLGLLMVAVVYLVGSRLKHR